jgi:hypothetical protein
VDRGATGSAGPVVVGQLQRPYQPRISPRIPRNPAEIAPRDRGRAGTSETAAATVCPERSRRAQQPQVRDEATDREPERHPRARRRRPHRDDRAARGGVPRGRARSPARESPGDPVRARRLQRGERSRPAGGGPRPAVRAGRDAAHAGPARGPEARRRAVRPVRGGAVPGRTRRSGGSGRAGWARGCRHLARNPPPRGARAPSAARAWSSRCRACWSRPRASRRGSGSGSSRGAPRAGSRGVRRLLPAVARGTGWLVVAPERRHEARIRITADALGAMFRVQEPRR